MSDEQVTDSELQAYADGRLGEERSRAVEAWLAARPDDAERIAAYRRLGEELRRAYDPVLDEPLPDWLGGTRAPRPR
jgi:anti-sigma factor RsiW